MKFGTVMHGETDVKLKFYMADCRNIEYRKTA